jgi:predicted AlkP superfamily phosphohydrolase/phosphomutase
MRYLRMLSNSAAAALLATAYMIALVLELNPTIALNPARLAPLVTGIGLFYAVHLTVIFYILLVLRQLLARELFSPAWVSVGVLAWLGAAAAAAGAAVMWENLSTFGLVLDGASALALARSTIVLAAAAGLFLVVALLRWSAPESRVAWAPLLVIVMIASAVLPFAMRGRGAPPLLEARPIEMTFEQKGGSHAPHVTVIAIDAGSLDFITGAAAEGRLPNFGRILDAGAVRHLATLQPTSAEAVWAAVATGKLPQKNGVRSASTHRLSGAGLSVQLLPEYCFASGLVRFGFLLEEPYTSATFRTRTVWNILSAQGFTVGVVGWPLTRPAPVVRGYVVADDFHRVGLTPSNIEHPSAVYPPELYVDAAAAMEGASTETAPILRASLGGDPRRETPARTDLIYERIARALAAATPAQVTLTRYQSLDPIGRYFLRFALPSEFGDVSDEERRQLGSTLERYYALIDEAIGRAMGELGAQDLLFVVSGFGMEPLGFGRRLVERFLGDPDLSGTHDRAPDGFLMAYGTEVARGRLTRASVVDVVPTLLYYLGLPIGRDMDGYVRTDMFQPGFIEDRPITYIPTYDR